ncbi:MAG: hypothetical protein MUQ20_02225 [Deltaproteobacteria bacterium]|nr:hypothetical protein [Deltaproteobacteria bacterium]
MRCPNCGYVSFDYLDQCVKCNTDLTGERHRLNLLEIRPDPISLQEIMERMPIITQKERGQKREASAAKPQGSLTSNEPKIDLDQGLPLDISIPSDLKDAPQASKISSPEEGGLELSLEGLETNFNPEKRK